jgi:hypothetical protein
LAKTVEHYPDVFDELIFQYQMNPLAFTLPHGRERKDREMNDGRAVLNDTKHDLIIVTAPKQTGKSALGSLFVALNIIPCDKEWPCFKEHCIRFREWRGPQKAIVASYSWDNTEILWESAYKKFLPRYELGEFAPGYGYFSDERGQPKKLAFGTRSSTKIKLNCGSEITFLSYTQSSAHWESRQCDIAHADEQMPEELFDALTSRQMTRGDYTPIIMTLTGYILDGRPDTGASGWIKRKLLDQGITKGRNIAQYRIGMKDVPDEIMSIDKKENARIQWVVEPEKLNDEKKKRQAEAVYWGGWEIGGGIVLDEWNPDIHMIKPFDLKKYDSTFYRYIDHGQDPCAALLIAVMPWGDSVVINEYYDFNRRGIKAHAQGIVSELCGNSVVKDWEMSDGIDEVFVEKHDTLIIQSSELDGRSFSTKSSESGRTIGILYNRFGCPCRQADLRHNDKLIPLLKNELAIQKGKKHINMHIGREWSEGMQKYGAPSLYIFNTCQNLKSEIEGWTINQNTGKPNDDRDHLISCLRWHTGHQRVYLGVVGRSGDWQDA